MGFKKFVKSHHKIYQLARRVKGLPPIRTLEPVLLDEPESGAALIIAPHPDDDVIACGGVMRKHITAGDDVSVIYMTDGENGGAPIWQRHAEARESTAVIGVNDINLIFLGYEDMGLKRDRENVYEMRSFLKWLNPDIVYVPNPDENHIDHQATSDIFCHASKGLNFKVYSYSVWTPCLPNCLIDITDVCHSKVTALQEHKSQYDLAKRVLGLNFYSTMRRPEIDFAEGFYQCSVNGYRALCQERIIKRWLRHS